MIRGAHQTITSSVGPGSIFLSSRAGLPATTVWGSTSFVTTLPAPTSAPSPIVTPREDDGAAADRGAPADLGLDQLPVVGPLRSSPAGVTAAG